MTEEKLSERLWDSIRGADSNIHDLIKEVEALEAKVKTLTENLEICHESYEALRLYTWGKDGVETRLAKAQDVLKDICHHVGKDCWANCKGDYTGNLPTSCLTYRIFDTMTSEKALDNP
jgi:hypothetical protein